MAKPGTVKALADEHEMHISLIYRGIKSASSGAAVTDAGDVRVKAQGILIECKMTGTPGKPPERKPKILREMEKITREAWAEGRDPVLCLRYYDPDSILADRKGWVDLTVRRTSDDALRNSDGA